MIASTAFRWPAVVEDSGVPIGDIADLCGHAGTTVTEKVYRHQLRPVLLNGAVAMDQIFDARAPEVTPTPPDDGTGTPDLAA
jgi:hypothetical protein